LEDSAQAGDQQGGDDFGVFRRNEFAQPVGQGGGEGGDGLVGVAAVRGRGGAGRAEDLQHDGVADGFGAGGVGAIEVPQAFAEPGGVVDIGEYGVEVGAVRGQGLHQQFFFGAEVVDQHAGAGAECGGQGAEGEVREAVFGDIADHGVEEFGAFGVVEGAGHGLTVANATGI